MSLRNAMLPVILLLSSCYVGDNVRDSAPVKTGAGIFVIIELAEVKSWPGGKPTTTPFQLLKGELLAVDEESIIINGLAIAQIAHDQIRSAEFPVISKFNFSSQPGESLDELKLYSRYPLGIDDKLMGSLLDAYGQDSLYVFK